VGGLALARQRSRLRCGFVIFHKTGFSKAAGDKRCGLFICLMLERTTGETRMLKPTLPEFEALAREGYNLIPVAREIAADLETPVSAFLKVARGDYSFLLESVHGGEKWGRYTFLGTEPSLVVRACGTRMDLIRPASAARDGAASIESWQIDNSFDALRRELKRYRAPELPELPLFFGGAVGFLAYDLVRLFEPRIPNSVRDDLRIPELYLMFTDTVLVFDNVRQSLKIIANVALDEFGSIDASYRAAHDKIERTISRLRQPAIPPCLEPSPSQRRSSGPLSSQKIGDNDIAITSNMTREDYLSMVSAAKDYIAAGDIIQVVPSQRFEAPLTAHPFNLYRSLRTINPSPYMFFLRLGDFTLAGASPETMVRVEGRQITLRPIAGTRRRGSDELEDLALERDLLADPKELAEHIMLVDLGRNDVGRVAKVGSVKVTELMSVERYSHVMHIVSNVVGELNDGMDAFDAFRATFPQGTVSGAPKIRAMEIIDELEPVRRGVYAGAVGYFSFTGNTDTAIALRTVLIKGDRVYIQAGGGVVADSDPLAEYEESCNKARAMIRALGAAREFEAQLGALSAED
jgi:anthranilate synthase component 1